MFPTLKDGDYILVRKTKNIKIGDIIIFFSVKQESKKKLVKRVVGEEGMYVGYSKDKRYIRIIKKINNKKNFYKIPQDFLFVVGDNYQNSEDSREGWLVNRKLVIGKVILKLFPPKFF